MYLPNEIVRDTVRSVRLLLIRVYRPNDAIFGLPNVRKSVFYYFKNISYQFLAQTRSESPLEFWVPLGVFWISSTNLRIHRLI